MTRKHAFWMALICLLMAFPVQLRAQNLNALLGEWSGQYKCGAESHKATLTLTLKGQTRNGLVSLFVPGQKKHHTAWTVRAISENGQIALQVVNWRQNPNRYQAMKFIGQVSADGKRFTGSVRNCGAFDFSRINGPTKDEERRIAIGEDNPREFAEKKCQSIGDLGERLDCVVEARNTPRFGRGIPGQLLRQDCENAYRDLNAERTPECLGGILFIDRRTQTASGLIKGSTSCKQFILSADNIIKEKFPLETSGVWRRNGSTPQLCANLDAMRVRVGATSANVCRPMPGRVEDELAGCTGPASSHPEFARLWKTAFDECTAGKQISMYRTIKKARLDNLQPGLFELSCNNVFALVDKYKIVSKADIENGRKAMIALEGRRPPRDDELVEALKVAIAKKYPCDDGGYQFNKQSFICIIGFGRSRDKSEIVKGLNEALGPMMNDDLTINLALVGAELLSCSSSGGNSYRCSYGIEMTCSFSGLVRGPDPTAPMSAKIHCPRFTDPDQRQSVFTWDGQKYATNL
jgi:hypothetical protein